MIIFLIRIMDADWEGICLESCKTSCNIKLLDTPVVWFWKTLLNYDRINQLSSLLNARHYFAISLQNKTKSWLFRQHGEQGYAVSCSSVHRLKMTEVIQQLSRGILSRKSHLQFLHPSAQNPSALTRSITTSIGFCFLVTLAMVVWVSPQYSHINTGNPRQSLPDI